MQLRYRFLTEADYAAVYRTFIDAFADYEIPDQPTEEALQRLLVRRGVNYETSVGVVDGDRIIAAMAVGIGHRDGREAAYDIFTGVVPGYRGRGLAGGMIEHARPALVVRGIDDMYLEVLQTNHAAIKAYKNVGFEIERDFECFHLAPGEFKMSRARESIWVARTPDPDWDAWETYADWTPAWQNSRGAIERAIDTNVFFSASVGGRCVGYAVFGPDTRDLFQLAVDPKCRRHGVGKRLVDAVLHAMDGMPLRILNIDASSSGDRAFYHSCGARSWIRQYEMRLRF